MATSRALNTLVVPSTRAGAEKSSVTAAEEEPVRPMPSTTHPARPRSGDGLAAAMTMSSGITVRVAMAAKPMAR
jgi:hypothetical protein